MPTSRSASICAAAAVVKAGNLLSGLPARSLAEEVVETLLELPGLRIERIVSTGQATPEGEWYD
jgi:cupin 2 domain-containing protein